MVCFCLVARGAFAESEPESEVAAQVREEAAKEEAADNPEPTWPANAVLGPGEVKLDQATIALPATHVFIPKDEAAAMLEDMGNVPGENLLGLIAPKDIEGEQYFITVRWDAEGYVRDDDADKMDTDEMLESFKDGVEESNEFRKEKGFRPIHIDGWGQVPTYDKSLHHMVWGLIVADDEGKSVNYNTRLLGREGYLALNLVCAPDRLEALRPMLKDLLAEVHYLEGKRYADFKEGGSDKVAEYGLAALVMGGAAAAGKTFLKVGLIAKFGKVILAALIAGKKFFLVAAIGALAFLKNLFTRKKEDTTPLPPAEPPAASPPPPDEPPQA